MDVYACGPKTVPVKRTFLNIAIVWWGGVGWGGMLTFLVLRTWYMAMLLRSLGSFTTWHVATLLRSLGSFTTWHVATLLRSLGSFTTWHVATLLRSLGSFTTLHVATLLRSLGSFTTLHVATLLRTLGSFTTWHVATLLRTLGSFTTLHVATLRMGLGAVVTHRFSVRLHNHILMIVYMWIMSCWVAHSVCCRFATQGPGMHYLGFWQIGDSNTYSNAMEMHLQECWLPADNGACVAAMTLKSQKNAPQVFPGFPIIKSPRHCGKITIFQNVRFMGTVSGPAGCLCTMVVLLCLWMCMTLWLCYYVYVAMFMLLR